MPTNFEILEPEIARECSDISGAQGQSLITREMRLTASVRLTKQYALISE